MTKRYIFYYDPNDKMYLFDIIKAPISGTYTLLDDYAQSLGLIKGHLSSTDNEEWVKRNFPKP